MRRSGWRPARPDRCTCGSRTGGPPPGAGVSSSSRSCGSATTGAPPAARSRGTRGCAARCPCTVGPGESTIVPVWVEAPLDAGDHLLEIDLVHEHVRWFEAPLHVPVVVAAPSRGRPGRPGAVGVVLITTVVARNYLPQARVLARSFRAHHPDGRVVVLVLDAPGDGLRDDEPFEVVAPADVVPAGAQRELRRMITIYNVMELATALKPFLLRHLLADRRVQRHLPRPRHRGVRAARRHRCGGRAPRHRAHPAPAHPGARRPPPARREGVRRVGRLQPRVRGRRDRGRRSSSTGGPSGAAATASTTCPTGCSSTSAGSTWRPPTSPRTCCATPASTSPTGTSTSAPSSRRRAAAISRAGPRCGSSTTAATTPTPATSSPGYHEGQPRVVLSESPALRDLCAAYGERLRAEGWDECRKLDYGLAFAANGMVLDGLMRRIVRQELLRRERTHEHDVGGVDDVPDPYEPDEVAAFVEMLRSPFPGSAAPRISRYLHALHHSRPDLQAACPDLTGWEGNHYLAWIREIGQSHLGLPLEVIPAADEIEALVEPPTERPAGVQLVGYLDAELGMGELGRGMLAILRAADEPVVAATETVTASRQRHDEGVGPDSPVGTVAAPPDADVNLVCVNADRLPVVVDRLGSEVAAGPHHDRRVGVGGRGVPRGPARIRPARRRGVDAAAPTRGGPSPRPSTCPCTTCLPRGRPGRPSPGAGPSSACPTASRSCSASTSSAWPTARTRSASSTPTAVPSRRATARSSSSSRSTGRRSSPTSSGSGSTPRGRPDMHVVDGYVSALDQAAAGRVLRLLRVAAPGRGLRVHDGRGDAGGAAGRGDGLLGQPRVHGRAQQLPRGLRPRARRGGQGPVPRRRRGGPTPTSTRPRRRCGGSSRIRPAPRPWASGPARTSSASTAPRRGCRWSPPVWPRCGRPAPTTPWPVRRRWRPARRGPEPHGWAGRVGARRCASGAVWPASSASSARPPPGARRDGAARRRARSRGARAHRRGRRC